MAGWLPVARQAAAARQCTQVRPPRAVGDARSSRNLSFWPTPRQAPPTTPSKSALLLTSDLLAAAIFHRVQWLCFKLNSTELFTATDSPSPSMFLFEALLPEAPAVSDLLSLFSCLS